MNKVKILRIIGFVLFVVGATYALMPHWVHQKLPLFSSFRHITHVSMGSVVVFLSLVAIISAEKIRQRGELNRKMRAQEVSNISN